MIDIIISNKKDGSMSSHYGSNGRDNRIEFFKNHGINNPIYLNIKNQNIIFDTNIDKINSINNYGDLYVDADAFITRNDEFIYCLFGDCIPLVIYDKNKDIVSLAHLGWKSVEGNLHIDLVNYFKDKYNSNIEDLVIYLGPSIKKKSHKIDINETIKQINDVKWKDYIEKTDNYYLIDLVGYVCSTLNDIGITNIEVDKTDTYADDIYFSHHLSWTKNKKNGRFIYGVRMKRG